MQTLEELLKNHRDGKTPERVFGLVMQGGGMRAAYSAATIMPLVDASLSDAFDHIVGSSAGALNGAYLMSGDRETYHTYTDSLTNRKFVNFLRFKKIVDIDFLVDKALKQLRPIDQEALRKSPSQLHIVMTNAKTGEQEVFLDHGDFSNIYEEFRATSALPVLYGRTVELDEGRYLDGGTVNLLPVDVALGLGCTDVVVVLTEELDSYDFNRPFFKILRAMTKLFARNYSEPIKELLPINESVLLRNIGLLNTPPQGVNLYVLSPSNPSRLVFTTSTNRKKALDQAHMGIDDMHDFLKKEF